jgi:hypothetical protein
MQYRGVEYTVAEDDRGWQWTVFLGNPETAQSGYALDKGTAILKVWTKIDRTLGPNKRRLARLARSKA